MLKNVGRNNSYVVVEVVVVDVVVAALNVTKTTEVVERSGIAFFSVACQNKTHFLFFPNPKL